VARQKYYGSNVRGTPSIFFNGKVKAPGGGPKEAAETKYQEYRDVIDPLLKEDSKIQLNVTARRAGDALDITAAARGYKPGDKLKLRLALVEPWVRYPGTNGLSYHAHVVRALPGGADGSRWPRTVVTETAKVNLGNLREAASKYLDAFEMLEGRGRSATVICTWSRSSRTTRLRTCCTRWKCR